MKYWSKIKEIRIHYNSRSQSDRDTQIDAVCGENVL